MLRVHLGLWLEMRGPRGGGLGMRGPCGGGLGVRGPRGGGLAVGAQAAWRRTLVASTCMCREAADLGCARRAASDARVGVFWLGDYREFDDVTWNDRGSLKMGCFTIGISSKQNGVKSRKYKETLRSTGYQ
jgi:hypothetical protein